MKTNTDLDIVVLGLGRFGRLWAKYMAKLGRVRGYDPFLSASANFAQRDLLPDRQALHLALQDCDVIFFCVPISALQKTIAALQPSLSSRNGHRTLWLMDTCSVKVQPLAWLRLALEHQGPDNHGILGDLGEFRRTNFRLLGLHPLFGPDSAGEVPEDLRVVLCPQELTQTELALWQGNFSSLGLQSIVMSADEHDRAAARTQGLTHLLGRVLEAMDICQSPIATEGYRALCQLRQQTCHDTWQLFIDLQQQNSYTAALRCELQEALNGVYTVLEKGYYNGGNTRKKN